jgi:hypothetical protein
LKQNVLKSIELITQCMHQDHLNKDFNFSYKTNLLELIVVRNKSILFIEDNSYLKYYLFLKLFITTDLGNKLTSDLKSMCYKVCSNIV